VVAKRVGILAYGLAGYALGGLTVPVMLLFFGGWGLPRTVDRGPSTSPRGAVVVDLALVSIFAIQHSAMARPAVKRRLPTLGERTTYVVASCTAMILLMVAWRPVGPVLWELGGAVRTFAAGGFALGFFVTYWATFTLGHTELLGLRQAWRSAVYGDGASPPPPELRVRGLYTLVRHPLMTGLLLCLWCAPALTAGRLLLASTLSTYILIGTRYEERDLRVTFGPTYATRVDGVPAFAPRLARRRSAR